MPFTNTTPTTTAESSGAWGGRARKPLMYRQRVNATLGQTEVALGVNIPALAHVINAKIQNFIVPTVTGTAAGATADSIALVMFPVSNGAVTQPLSSSPSTATVKALTLAAPTVTQPVPTAGIMIAQTPGIGTSQTNGVYRGVPLVERISTSLVKAENPYTVGAYLALVPSLLSSNTFQINGTNITSGFIFGTGSATGTGVVATVDVQLYVETYEDNPSF